MVTPGEGIAKAAGCGCDPAATTKRKWRGGSAGYSYGERVADFLGGAGGLAHALGEVGGDGVLDAGGLGLVAEVAQQEGDGEDGGAGVGLALARDVGRRAVHGLEHRRELAGRVDVPARGDADTAGDGRGEVGDDVAEEVVGDDHVEAGRVGDEVDRRRVHMDVVRGDLGELL